MIYKGNKQTDELIMLATIILPFCNPDWGQYVKMMQNKKWGSLFLWTMKNDVTSQVLYFPK